MSTECILSPGSEDFEEDVKLPVIEFGTNLKIKLRNKVGQSVPFLPEDV